MNKILLILCAFYCCASFSRGEKFSLNKPVGNMEIDSGTIMEIHTHTLISCPVVKENFINAFSVYPNPFEKGTYFHYAVEKDCNLNIKVLNIIGKEVYTALGAQQVKAGNYTVYFDGGSLAGGVYFCVIQINGITFKTQKIILAR
jgi:hypothetical protein